MHPKQPLLLCAVLLVSAACAEDLPTFHSVEPSMAASTNHAGVGPFVLAQGTWCDRDLPGDCDALDQLGIGWVNAFYDGDAPIVTLDPGGVNARWYAAHRAAEWPVVPAFAVQTGVVQDVMLPDGRREIAARLRVSNTFVAFYDLDFNPILGASFEEFGGVAPALASIDFEYRAILPAGFVGMPDLVQPEAWEAITRLDATIRTSAILRGDLRGIPAGTAVDVVYRIREFPRGDGRSAKPNAGYAMSVRATRGELSVTSK